METQGPLADFVTLGELLGRAGGGNKPSGHIRGV